jgi:hypothetical protein
VPLAFVEGEQKKKEIRGRHNKHGFFRLKLTQGVSFKSDQPTASYYVLSKDYRLNISESDIAKAQASEEKMVRISTCSQKFFVRRITEISSGCTE